MGLAYATRLIPLNQGALSLESHPAQGTSVTITLPRLAWRRSGFPKGHTRTSRSSVLYRMGN